MPGKHNKRTHPSGEKSPNTPTTTSKRRATQSQSAQSNSSASNTANENDPAPIPQEFPLEQFASGRALAVAIAKRYNLVELGGKLLNDDGNSKGSSVRLRMWETIMEYLFGKPSSHPHHEESARPRIIWDIPAPARELLEEETP